MKTQLHLLSAVLAALFVTACNHVADQAGKPSQPLDISQQVFEGYTAFGFDVFNRLARETPDSNLVLSPTSLAFALAMTYNGADGETAREMAEVLGISGSSLEVFNASNAAWLAALRDPDEGVQLAIANSLWIRDRFPVETDFVDLNQRHFDATVERLDFDDPAAVDAINTWVANRTNDRIQEIIQEIDPLDMLFLINAVYFLGEWTVPFEEDGTSPGRFLRPDGKDVPIPMMSRRDTIEYHRGNGFQAVRLPYGERGRFGMILLLPDPESTLEALYRDLDIARWRTILTALEPTYLELNAPRFRVEWEKTLNDVLTALGMETAFLPDRADFSRINPDPHYDDLHVSEVLQKTFLQVNEKGTEAAAVTSVRMGVTSLPSYPVLHFDRPFFLAIHDRATDTILIMGQITNPQDPDWQAP